MIFQLVDDFIVHWHLTKLLVVARIEVCIQDKKQSKFRGAAVELDLSKTHEIVPEKLKLGYRKMISRWVSKQ